jgi:hypothetical protein
MRNERGALANLAQTVDGHQHLVLASTPRSRGIDV